MRTQRSRKPRCRVALTVAVNISAMTTASPDSFVRTFTALLAAKDIDAASAMISDDCEYDNVPIGKAFGPTGLRDTLTGFFAMCDFLDWEIVRQSATGDMNNAIVLNERIDRFVIKGTTYELLVAGVYEIRDGKITLWRDYFDKELLMTAFSAAAS
jgi:limonene-1,2-epoxide hydrolase